ncbi:MAG: hypothetical protein GW798_08225 [Roseovarius sp.]|nr:hypothetical protein [Roseovarius sp.]
MIDVTGMPLASSAQDARTGPPKTSLRSFPDGNDKVQGVFQERTDGRITFHSYVVREHQ